MHPRVEARFSSVPNDVRDAGRCGSGIPRTDWMMPTMNGIELAAAVRANPAWAAIPIIMMSAAVLDAAPPDICHYFSKPVDMETLLKTIKTLVHQLNQPT